MTENLSKIKIDSVVKRAIEMFNHESSGDVHPFFHECPRVSMPFISHRSAIRKSINEWLEDSLRSSRNIEILAEHSLGVIGEGDRDLRMREMTSEEGASLERYADMTRGIMNLKRNLNVSYIFFISGLAFSVFSNILFYFILVIRPELDHIRKKSH